MLETLQEVIEIVSYLPNDLAFKVVFGQINQNDMAHVIAYLQNEWGFNHV